MKRTVIAAAFALIAVAAYAADAFAQSGYYSQGARQDREYKSLSNATKRAYGK